MAQPNEEATASPTRITNSSCGGKRRNSPFPVLETPFGTINTRFQLKAVIQSIAFVCLVGVFALYQFVSTNNSDNNYSSDMTHSHLRWLQADGTPTSAPTTTPTTTTTPIATTTTTDSCDDLEVAEENWHCVFYGLGVLYMFLALAIACDEFFVPALEEMSSPRRLNLSMDVAGATLMAAGGSAPELFTSLFGTLQESEVGFGTIVGSAVFNVMFVIGMCSLLAKEVLNLTWWPLFRDSLYYAVSLVVLAVFVGVVSENQVELWEAAVLFAMYIGYCLLMWQNANLYQAITGKVLEYPDEDDDDDDGGGGDNHDNHHSDKDKNKKNGPEAPAPSTDPVTNTTTTTTTTTTNGETAGITRTPSHRSVLSSVSARALENATGGGASTPHFRWQGTFRAGILKLLKDPDSWMDTAGVGIVAKIAGDADYVFQQVDMDGNGHVDREELKQLFNLLECYVSPTELEEVFNSLDEDKDGTISQREFTNWYCRSEERILSQVRHVFDTIDANKSNTIDAEELKTLLAMLDPHVTDVEVAAALDSMYKHGSREEITFEEFSEWYRKSIVFERQKKLIEEDMEGVWENLYPPKDGSWRDWVWYLVVLPLVLVMTLTTPDVRRPGLGGWCYVSFFISIGWIGGFSYLMVSWAEIIGNTIGIPAVIMGLTVLAAGTSVPDLLSSVIVARRGNGDMAVSSSIGSNIFDILVGLPVPWLIFTIMPNDKDVVTIGTDNIFLFLVVLLGMLVFVIGAVHCQGWKLTKVLGGFMFLFYFGFLAFGIWLEVPFESC